jgi:hypothetical protein
MKQQQDCAGPSTSDFRDSRYDGAIRTMLGEALRRRYDLMEPLPQGLVELLGQLDARVHVGDPTQAKLDAEADEWVAAMVWAAGRKPVNPENGEAGGGRSWSHAVASTEGRRP